MRPSEASGAWWTWRELNPRPPARQAGALPLSYRPGLRFATLTQAAPSDVEGRRATLSAHATSRVGNGQPPRYWVLDPGSWMQTRGAQHPKIRYPVSFRWTA